MRNTIKFVLLVAIAFSSATVLAADADQLALIPLPQHVQRMDGAFTLNAQTGIYADWSSRKTADFFARRLGQSTGFPLKVHWRAASSDAPDNSIFFTTKKADSKLGSEGYQLLATPNGITIRAPAQAGLFYGGETVMQLLPPEAFSTNIVTANWQVPCVQIEDWPRFPWRGVMLDVSRHFYNKDEVENIIDEMALYKLNRFHWHLVDDDGWRIEIKKYPKLTQIGAWRNGAAVARNLNNAEPAADISWTKAAPDKFTPDGRYGGFYTQKQIREVVAYARARHIIVVPEIEMPGHSGDVLAAYPELGCSGQPYQIEGPLSAESGVLNPANPEVFIFLQNVLDETFKLFPGPYVHIGGDEVFKGAWDPYPSCQALMKREGLKNEAELQSWFTRRMVNFIIAHGKIPIGWSEIMRGGLATNAVVMDWIGGGKETAEAGHDAIMTPSSPTDYCYLDHYQSTNHAAEPRAIGGYLPLQKVYSFEPIPADLPAPLQSHILGPQANLWTEYVASLPHAQYMIFPRACALAEVGWSAKDTRNWDDFYQRLMVDEKCLDELGVNYRPGGQEPNIRYSRHKTHRKDTAQK
ncbi:MAG TPA: beta-N-acetylhexosaminidase [Candidatus Acidoferrum sp.]|nr:beta-N-acetylhexosaminidase [Candidatus Acidoferrum sp.]